MNGEIELVSDGDGLAVIGHPADVDRFFLDQGFVQAEGRDLDLRRLAPMLGAAGAAAKVGGELAANSGRWVKLTKESAEAVRKYGLMPTSTPGVSHAMIGKPGDIKQWLQIVHAPGALLSGPMALSALSTMMQQRAMQEQMDRIVEYLQVLDEKVDDILRAQKDGVLADLIGVDLVIDDAMTIREHAGRVGEMTWSKVQATSLTIARTQAYSLRQLDAIAEKLERHFDLGDLARATRDAEPRVREWLAVLARSFQLQDAVSVLELDRVLDSAGDELELHRVGVAAARSNRLETISRSTGRLLAQMDATVRRANSRVLLNPFDSPAAVRSSNSVSSGVLDLRERLGIDSMHESADARRWGQAAGEIVGRAVATTTGGALAAKRFGDTTLDRAVGTFRNAGETDGAAPRALTAATEAATALSTTARDAAGTVGRLFRRESASGSVDRAELPAERDAGSVDDRAAPPLE